MKTTTTAAALFVLTYTTAANAGQLITHRANDRRELLGILFNIQAKGTPIYHATIKAA